MEQIHSFAPVRGVQPHLLILGSMPSVISLHHHAYYAHPRNLFWSIMARLIGFDPAISYEERISALTKKGIALWDVFKSCERAGSLDSNIKEAHFNDIAGFLSKNPIMGVFLNGGKARQGFYQHIGKNFNGGFDKGALVFDGGADIPIYALPSTSPANARVSGEDKYQQWKKAWQDFHA